MNNKIIEDISRIFIPILAIAFIVPIFSNFFFNGLDNNGIIKQITNEEIFVDSLYSRESSFRNVILEKLNNQIFKFPILTDSINLTNKTEREELFKLLVLKSIESLNDEFIYEIDISKKEIRSKNLFTKPLFFKVTGKVDKTKIQRIVENNQMISELSEFIRYGDFIIYDKEIIEETRIDIIVIIGGALLALILIIIFIPKLFQKEVSDKLSEDINESESIASKVRKEIENQDEELQTKESIKTKIHRLEVLNKKIEVKLEYLKFKDKAYYIIEEDVYKLFARSKQLYSRSTLMLILGVLVAVIGIVVFYIALPEYSVKDVNSYLAQSIRPALVLLFIQSIAWFLLRQYRILIEDYKYFHKQYEKRSNYLACYDMYSAEDINDAKMYLSYVLLNEDFTGKLNENEKTEFNENVKMVDENPMFVLFRDIVNKVSSSVINKDKTDKNQSKG